MRNIPVRFQADCVYCGDVLDIRQDGTHQRASGWVKRRAQGGANALVLPERINVYAHEMCIESMKHHTTGVQMDLFAHQP